jgi:hypothetical protein
VVCCVAACDLARIVLLIYMIATSAVLLAFSTILESYIVLSPSYLFHLKQNITISIPYRYSIAISNLTLFV